MGLIQPCALLLIVLALFHEFSLGSGESDAFFSTKSGVQTETDCAFMCCNNEKCFGYDYDDNSYKCKLSAVRRPCANGNRVCEKSMWKCHIFKQEEENQTS